MADMGIHVPEKVTKVKSAMALHLKIHFMSCTNYVFKKCTIFGYAALLYRHACAMTLSNDKVQFLTQKSIKLCKVSLTDNISCGNRFCLSNQFWYSGNLTSEYSSYN